jgi:hypothetical protein
MDKPTVGWMNIYIYNYIYIHIYIFDNHSTLRTYANFNETGWKFGAM